MPSLAHRVQLKTHFSPQEHQIVRLMLRLVNDTRERLTPPAPPITEVQVTALLRQMLHDPPPPTGGD